MITLIVKDIPLFVAAHYLRGDQRIEVHSIAADGSAYYRNGRASLVLSFRDEIDRQRDSGFRLLHVERVCDRSGLLPLTERRVFLEEQEFWTGLSRQLNAARIRQQYQKMAGDCYRYGDPENPQWIRIQSPHPRGGWIGLIEFGPGSGKQQQFQDEDLTAFAGLHALGSETSLYSSAVGKPLSLLTAHEFQEAIAS